MNVNLEDAFLLNTIRLDRRNRIIGLLRTAKKREKLRALLPHHIIFEPSVIQPLSPKKQDAKVIEQLLSEKGACGICRVLSASAELDRAEMQLKEALDIIVGNLVYGGTILICNETLGYYEGEEMGDRFILHCNS